MTEKEKTSSDKAESAVPGSQDETASRQRLTLDHPPSPPSGPVGVTQNQDIKRRYATDEEQAELVRILQSGAAAVSPEALAEAIKHNPKYDDAEWHYGGDFPEGVPDSYGFTHIGFYLAWAAEHGFLSDFIREQTPDDLARTLAREVTPIHLLEVWDGQLGDDMLSEEGNQFSRTYYEADEENGYFADYGAAFPDLEIYRIAPTWENYDRLKPALDRRLEEWRERN